MNTAFELTDETLVFCKIRWQPVLLKREPLSLLNRLFILITIILCALQRSQAQDYSFRHLTTSEGLLSDLRIVMAEDRLGRLWIGSDEGINVFDGYQLSSYSLPDKSGLLNNNVRSIYCDKNGTIWIYTPAGIQYKKENDSRFRKLETGKDSLNASTPLFGETLEGDLVVVTGANAWFINKELNIRKAEVLSALIKKNGGVICFIPFRKEKDEWLLGFGRDLVLVNLGEQKHLRSVKFSNTWYACRVNDSTVLAGGFVKDTVALINLYTGSIESINDWKSNDGQRMGGYSASIVHIGKNKYAIGCRYYGAYIADLENKTLLHLTHDPSDPTSLRTVFCRRIFITRDGTMFVHAKGLSYTPLNKPLFNIVKIIVNETGEKYDGGFNSFTEDKKGNTWICTNSHLAKWDRLSNTCKFYPYFNAEGGPQKFKTVRSAATDKLDRVWVATFGGGLGMLRPDGTYEQFSTTPSDPEHSIPSMILISITKDRDGNFLLGSNAGFGVFDPILRKAQRFINHPKLKKISRNQTHIVFPDKKNNWWIAQDEGLFYYDKQRDSLIQIRLPEGTKENAINTVCTDSMGNIYAGGWGGLYIIPAGTFVIKKHMTKADGLFSNNVMNLVCDPQGKVWIIGNIGVSRYDPATGQLRPFDAVDGIEQSNHPICSGYLSSTGEMFIGSSEGFNYFYPSSIDSNTNPIKVFVTSLELKDSVISLPQLHNRVFKYYQNNFTFTYQSVEFNRAPIIQYRYKLNGFDTAWVIAGKERTARYTNLAAGKYNFIVEASANGKDWYASQHDLSFIIRKALWQRWWFRTLVAALIAGGIYYYYRNRLKQINKEARMRSDYEIKLNELENSALRTQMNPHFIFNSLNTINSFINSNDRIQANQYISKFSKLVRLILDHSREKKIVLSDELEVAELYMQLEQIRFEQKFSYSINSKDVDPSITEVPPLIIQPFVENAILHGLLPKGSGGQIKVEISRKGNLLQCTIEDNGIGRAAAKKIKETSGFRRKSHGMEITLKRIELFNKEQGVQENVSIIDLFDEQGNSSGTKVEILLAHIDTF